MVKKHKYKIGQECIIRKRGRNSILTRNRNSILLDTDYGKTCHIIKKVPAEEWDNKDDPEYAIEFLSSPSSEYLDGCCNIAHICKYNGIHESELEKKIRR